jgi:hypothetical protein
VVAKQPSYSREFTSLRSRQQTEELLPTEAAFERTKYQAGHTRINSYEEDKKKRITQGDAGHGAVWDTYRFGQEKSIWRKGEMIE